MWKMPQSCQIRGIFCEVCYQWFHTRCINMSNPEYQRLSLSDEGRCCHDSFKGAFPFNITYLSDASDTSSRFSVSHDPSPVGHCSIFYSNCRSLFPKMDHLRTIAASSSPSVIALCETWLDESVQDTVLFMPTYHLVRRDRNRHVEVYCCL